MKKVVYGLNLDATGGAQYNVVRLVQAHYKRIRFEEFLWQKKGTRLFYNIYPRVKKVSKAMRQVMFIAGGKINDNGRPRTCPWEKLDHVVFNSEFLARIALSDPKFRNIGAWSVILPVGGAHTDKKMMRPRGGKKIKTDHINFMTCAKWWKRRFKRLKHIRDFFESHILKRYPSAVLHVFAVNAAAKYQEGRIVYYPKSFSGQMLPRLYKKCHVLLHFSPFDTGPLAISEAMHYRMPFVCFNNCAGPEYLKHIKGKCGEVVNIDPPINSVADCRRHKPFTSSLYRKPLDYGLIMEAVVKIIDNYEEYTTWRWSKSLNYARCAKRWKKVLLGK